MSKKSIGSSAERELLAIFWKSGWAAIRSPGSGSAKHPSPDILASNKKQVVAIECKVTKDDRKYIPNAEIKQLNTFASLFGAEAWIATKFKRNGWYFMKTSELIRTDKSCVISIEWAIKKGITLHSFFGLETTKKE